MQIFITLSAIVLLAAFSQRSDSKSAKHENKRSVHKITILFTGDIMQHMPQVEAAWNNEMNTYVYDSCFKHISQYLSNADLAIANLETTLAGKPYSGYPAFSSPDQLIHGLLNAGIDIVGTANNHCCDRGQTGVDRTISVLDSLGMMHMGTYKDADSYKKYNPLIINTRGFRLAFLNYTYGTNGLPVTGNNIVSLIEPERIKQDLKAVLDSAVDATIVFIHWGDEYQRLPNDFQKSIANLLFTNGVDIIIGSHPHVIQPMEWRKHDTLKKDQLVVWSLGNYVSNQRKRYTDGGAMFALTLHKEKGKAFIANAEYQLTWVFNPLINGRRQYYILPAAAYENDTVMLDPQSQSSLREFLSDSRGLLQSYNIGGINERK